MASARRYACAAAAALLMMGLAAQNRGAATAASKTPTKSAPKATKKPSKKSARSKGKKVVAHRQTEPTPERYKQIQQALALRGYLREEPSGKWTPGASEALRSFQAANGLPATGKLDSMSLIELGLGPWHDKPAAALQR